MADIPGKSSALLIDFGSGFVTVARGKTIGLSINSDTVDVSTMDRAPDRTILPEAALVQRTFTFAGVVSDAAVHDSLKTLANTAPFKADMKLRNGSGTATEQFEGEAQLTNYDETESVDAAAEFSCSLTFTGTVTLGVSS